MQKFEERLKGREGLVPEEAMRVIQVRLLALPASLDFCCAAATALHAVQSCCAPSMQHARLVIAAAAPTGTHTAMPGQLCAHSMRPLKALPT